MGLSFFDSVVMKRYFALKPVEGGGARTVMTLSNGMPFLLEKDVGQGHGRVMQFCTTATTRGSNLPTRRLFLPLMHQLTYCLAQSQGATEDVRPGRAVRFAGVARPSSQDEPKSPVEVTDPRGVTSAAPLEKGEAETAYPVFSDTARCGIYHWRRHGDDSRVGAFVVNLNVEEGDLTPLDREKLAPEPSGRAPRPFRAHGGGGPAHSHPAAGGLAA